jgi:hypothetical protein
MLIIIVFIVFIHNIIHSISIIIIIITYFRHLTTSTVIEKYKTVTTVIDTDAWPNLVSRHGEYL